MNPILLVHGYSAEGDAEDPIAEIYGSLPAALKARFPDVEIRGLNVSRYVSLEDGIHLDDIARAMDNALQADHSDLLRGKFDIICHSTGSLVVRNWIRLFSKKPSPIKRFIQLAPANFGSGWAHVGKGRLAKWAQLVFRGGSERGLAVLDSLELGSSATLDLHQHFLCDGESLFDNYKIHEYCLTGSQVKDTWVPIPIRYAHEDGSDGVVRASAANPNFNYVCLEPTRKARTLSWEEIAQRQQSSDVSTTNHDYRVCHMHMADEGQTIPFGILFECAHSGEDIGIVSGDEVRDDDDGGGSVQQELMELLAPAFAAETPAAYRKVITAYNTHTEQTYQRAAEFLEPGFFGRIRRDPRAQYDAHAQVIFRLRDDLGRPVPDFDIFFDSDELAALQGETVDDAQRPINDLFEHTHANGNTRGILVFYLRLSAFDENAEAWDERLSEVGSISLEIQPTEPQTEDIQYLPVNLRISNERLRALVQPHRSTIIDVELLRRPAPQVFRIEDN